MVHVCAHAIAGSLLFRTWTEGRELLVRLARAVRHPVLGIMPTHAHARAADADEVRAIGRALRGFALWRNHRRGESGPVFREGTEATPISDARHARRTARYILLNPCRDGLVSDPLAWPLSTHRDAVGLALPQLCRTERDPAGYHAYISGDPDVDLAGTPLPSAREVGRATLADVAAAVSALTRTTAQELRLHGLARNLLIRAARRLTDAIVEQIAAAAGVHVATVYRCTQDNDPRVALVARVVGDRRFALLGDSDLRSLPAWAAYRRLR